MTRKDLALIASVIRAERDLEARKVWTLRYAEKLAAENPAFDRARWFKACCVR